MIVKATADRTFRAMPRSGFTGRDRFEGRHPTTAGHRAKGQGGGEGAACTAWWGSAGPGSPAGERQPAEGRQGEGVSTREPHEHGPSPATLRVAPSPAEGR